jgi:3-methylfumaryl-CoA hydratase
VGDELTRRSSVRDVSVKHGRSGAMAFVTVGQQIHRDGQLLVEEEQDIVYRSQPDGQDRVTPRDPAAPTSTVDTEAEIEIEIEIEFDFEADPVTLFQFSALTFNSHRIHYDYRYATETEGYPGLVVHGPLLALLLLEIPRRHREGGWLESFSYRLTRPAFADARIVARGRSGMAGALELSAGAADHAPSISGVAARQRTKER